MKLAAKLDKYNEENDIPFGYLKPDGRSENDPVTKWNKTKYPKVEVHLMTNYHHNDCGDAFDY